MHSIAREHFFDWQWKSGELNSAAEFWLQLCSRASRAFGYSRSKTYDLEVRLSGYLERNAESILRELNSRIATWDVPEPAVRREEHEFVLSSGEISGRLVPPEGLGLPFLGQPPLTCLVAEFRFRVIAKMRREKVSSTLVLVGELLDNVFQVKAVWISRAPADDDYCRRTPMNWESELVAGLNQFRETGKVKSSLVECFSPPMERLRRDALVEREQRLTFWLKNVPFGRPRLYGLLWRFIFFCTLLTVFSGMFVWGVLQKDKIWGLAALPALLTIVGLVNFLSIELGYYNTYHQYRRTLANNLRRVKYACLTNDEAEPLVDDPAIWKRTAELEEVQFSLLGDFTVAPSRGTIVVFRVFRAPDEITYLILICTRAQGLSSDTNLYVWPASITLEAQTFFDHGGYVDSVFVTEYSYWSEPVAENTLFREKKGGSLTEFFEEHVAVATAFANDRSLIPCRHESLEKYVARQQAIHDALLDYREQHPYSRWDHLRWYLQLGRPEYSGKRSR